MRLTFDAFTPDLPSLAGGNDKAFNVLPAKESYRPVADLSSYTSNGLSARAQGAKSFLDRDGNTNMFAGDATKLYRATGGATTFADVSGTTYSTPADGRWSFASYGNNQVVATNFVDAPQLYTIGTSTTFGTLAAAAPKGRYACIAKNFLWLANINDGSVNLPYALQSSKQGDITTWPTPGTNAAIAALSNQYSLSGDTGWIQGIEAGLAGADMVVVCERGLYRATFVGGDLIWGFDLVEGARGTPAPGSLVVMGGSLFYLGEDGFYVTNGIASQPIGASQVDKFFFSDATHGVDVTNYHRISALADPINKVVMWAYPSVSSTAGALDRVLCYNWEVGKWSLITGLASLDLMMPVRSLGYSLDTLDTLSSSLDALVYSLDSRQLTGGRALIGAFDTATHTLKTFTGSNLAATVTTTEAGHPSGQRMMVSEAWPIIEGSSVTATLTPITRNRQNDAQVTGTAVAQNATGFCPLRVNARYIELQLDIAAGGTWSHAFAVDVPDNKIVLAGMR